MSEIKLDGRVALITGAASGLGRAIALKLGQAGCRLALLDRSSPEQVLVQARAAGIQAHAYACDVGDESQVEATARAVLTQLGAPHIVVNSAGIAVRKAITELSIEEWNRVMNTNVTGVFLICRAFVPHMKGRGYGRILNLGSIMGHVSTPGRGLYSASKSAVLAITRALALELAAEGITVVGISPGFVATEFTAMLRANPGQSQELLSQVPLRRWGEPDEIAELALYLCSEAAGFITGTDVVIDGGWLAQ